MGRDWTPISAGLFDAAADSNSTTRISKEQWPEWAEAEAKAIDFYGWKSGEANQADMIMIRAGKGIPEEWKVDRYILKRENEGCFMSPPCKEIPYGPNHHTNVIPPWNVPSATSS